MKRRDRQEAPLTPRETPLEVHLQSEVLPDELLTRIMTYLPFRTVVGCFGPTNKMFLRVTNVEWFCKNVRELTVVPSLECPTLADGLAHAANTRELWILPGVYRDSIRITKNISVCGVGKLGSVVVEAPGWNDAIYFAGLGMDGEYVNPKTSDTGELADISNLVFRAPNPEQGFIAHIVRGTPRIHHCDIQGGIWISGCKPTLSNNTIRCSRSCGVKITDRAMPELKSNVILNNKFGGIKVKRSNPVLTRNTISHNLSYGMVITKDSSPTLLGNEIKDQLDQPKFNPLTGVYGPLESSQVCGFCGSWWSRRNSFSNLTPSISRDDLKVFPRTNSEFVEQKARSTISSVVGHVGDRTPEFGSPNSAAQATTDVRFKTLPSVAETKQERQGSGEVESSGPSESTAPSAAYFINHCCWVDPGEISSDDDQLYGDDDIGNL
jgi:parallel beta-helix repeat protein